MVSISLAIILQRREKKKYGSLHKSCLYLQWLAINKYNCVHKILLTLILKILILL